jgi:hypothetical protein
VLLLPGPPDRPETIDVEIGYIFHPSALDDPLFEHKLKLADAGVQVFVQQDQDATTKVQRGLRSRFAPRGRYSWQEESHVQFNRWLVQRYRRTGPLDVAESGAGVRSRGRARWHDTRETVSDRDNRSDPLWSDHQAITPDREQWGRCS